MLWTRSRLKSWYRPWLTHCTNPWQSLVSENICFGLSNLQDLSPSWSSMVSALSQFMAELAVCLVFHVVLILDKNLSSRAYASAWVMAKTFHKVGLPWPMLWVRSRLKTAVQTVVQTSTPTLYRSMTKSCLRGHMPRPKSWPRPLTKLVFPGICFESDHGWKPRFRPWFRPRLPLCIDPWQSLV